MCSNLPPRSAILYLLSISDLQFLIYKTVLMWRANEIIYIRHFSQCIAHDGVCRNVSPFPSDFQEVIVIKWISPWFDISATTVLHHLSLYLFLLNPSSWGIYINGQCFRHLDVPCLPEGINCVLYIMKTTYHKERIITDLGCTVRAQAEKECSEISSDNKSKGIKEHNYPFKGYRVIESLILLEYRLNHSTEISKKKGYTQSSTGRPKEFLIATNYMKRFCLMKQENIWQTFVR